LKIRKGLSGKAVFFIMRKQKNAQLRPNHLLSGTLVLRVRYDAEAAKPAWERSLEVFKKNLK